MRLNLFIAIFLIATVVNGQQPSIQLDSIGFCNGTSVQVALRGKSLVNMGAMTLYIHYPAGALTFKSVENIHPSIKGLLYNAIPNPSRISLVWSSTNGLSFQDAVLLELKFDVINPSGVLKFALDSCEVADANLPPQIINVTFKDGSVYPAFPTISVNPVNRFIAPAANCTFSVSSLDADGFHWQESRDYGVSFEYLEDGSGISGTHTEILQLDNVPATYNNYQYRCAVSKSTCNVFSQAGILKVDKIYNVPDFSSIEPKIIVAPVPFADLLKFQVINLNQGVVEGQLISVTGQTVMQFDYNLNGNLHQNFELKVVYLPVGFYMFRYKIINGNRGYYGNIKLQKVQSINNN
jgi:hypothetical protein